MSDFDKDKAFVVCREMAGVMTYFQSADEETEDGFVADFELADVFSTEEDAKYNADPFGAVVKTYAEAEIYEMGNVPGKPAVKPSLPDPNRMSVRDVFAANALAGLLATHPDRKPDAQKVAVDAYYYADAMVEQRAKPSTFTPRG